MISKLEFYIVKSDTDAMGHLNNVRYVKFLEKGRTQYYLDADYSIERFKREEIGRAVVHLDVHYIREVLQGERLTLVTKLVRHGKSSLVLNQTFYNSKDIKVCEANVTSVIFDINKRKSIPIPIDLLKLAKSN